MSRIIEDWQVNAGRRHIQILLVMLRLSQLFRRSGALPVRLALGYPMSALYRSVALFGFSIDIPVSTSIGHSLAIHHGMGLVIHSGARIGSNVTLRHTTTIGSAGNGLTPIIGDGVQIGPNSCIIGGVQIGDYSTIGAGSVVVHSVEPSSTVAGNPARRISKSVQ